MASDVNSAVLVGRLTRDAELKYTNSGTAVCKFAIAVNRNRKTQNGWEEEANFFDIVVWGRQGEAIQQYLQKGKQVAVQGELRQSRWEQNGQTRSRVELHAQNLQLLGGPGQGGSGQGGRRPGPHDGGPSGGEPDGFSGPEDFTDDIPF